MKRFRQFVAAGLIGLLPVWVGCSKKPDVIVKTVEGNLTEADIDRDPTALLPSGAVGLMSLDAKQLMSSEFGQQMLQLARSKVPIPASAGFDPGRDLERMIVGFYSMQGADAIAIATGTFDPQAIEQAADGTTNTPLGAPLVKQTYAGRTLYVSRNVGFVVMTRRTVLLGNETAMRRVLDRIEEGRVQRAIPAWFDEMGKEQTAPIYGGADFAANPVVGPNTAQLPFMEGVQTGKVVGNFQPPGLNLAGTLSYGDGDAAQRGAGQIQQIQQLISRYGWMAMFVGLSQPIRSLQAQVEGKDVKFVAAVDGQAVSQLLGQLAEQVPQAQAPAPGAPTSPAPGAPPAPPPSALPPQ